MQNKPIIVSKENYLYYVKNTRNIKKGEPVEGASLYELVKYLKDNKNIDKILQFIKNDEDKKVSNEVESIILQNLINGSDRIKMPNKTDYEFITKEFSFGEKGNAKFFDIRKGNNFDRLVDKDGDGYADYRITANFEKVDLKGIYKIDEDIDGKYDKQVF